jgi:PAS domain-containing protein
MTESRLAQETLRESEQLARGIIDTALDAFVQVDEKGLIRDWNAQAENIFGWPRDEALATECVRSDGPAGRARTSQESPCKPSCFPAKRSSVTPPRTPDQAAGRQGNHG